MTSPDSPTCSSAASPDRRPAARPGGKRRPAAREAHLTVMRRVVTAPVPEWGEEQEETGRVCSAPVPREAAPPVAGLPGAALPPAPAGAPSRPEEGWAAGPRELRVRIRRAWQLGRSPRLLLPAPGPHPYSIGRAAGSVLRLNDFTVSRAHAQLRSTGSGWTLRDLGSSNGTWVNGSRVTCTASVRPGDHVRFGQVGFRLAAD